MTGRQALIDGIAALGLSDQIDAGQVDQLVAYVALLEKWNRTHNLTAIREPDRMITHHLLDSLAILPHLPAAIAKPTVELTPESTIAPLRIIDIGSGGGLPGIPLAIARRDVHIALLDSSQKKAAFLRQAAIELPLVNVEVIAQRVEDFGVDCAPSMRFDVAISRAFSDLALFAQAATHLLAPGGRLLAMKGVYPHEELAQLPGDVRVYSAPALRVPGLDGQRHLVIMAKAA